MSINNEINNSLYTSSIDPALFQSVTDQAQLNTQNQLIWKSKKRIRN